MYDSKLVRAAVCAACVTAWCVSAGAARAEDAGDVQELRDEMTALKDENRAMKDQLGQALSAIEQLRAQSGGGDSALDRALDQLPRTESTRAQAARRGPRRALRPRLVDLSLVGDFSAGASTVRDEQLESLQGGEHDPKQRGFTLQQIELSALGAVDPYFMGEVHLIYFLDPEGESRFEVEEAFLTTTSLPHGLQLEAGTFFTEFGRLNPRHPHLWNWQDQPVALSRMFGGDGMRGPGMRLGWLTELPWYSEFHLTAQNADGETMVSFLATDEFENAMGDPIVIGGRSFAGRETQRMEDLVYTARWQNAFELTEGVSASLGLSTAFGPNASGPNGDTWIHGADAVFKWVPPDQRGGWPFVVVETEYVYRDYDADNDSVLMLPSTSLKDWGGYVQGLYGFMPRWAAGLRAEYASGSGASVGGRDADPFRDDRLRLSPLLAFYPTEYSRLRLQYNYDRAGHLVEDDDAHTVWLGFEFSLGAHPAHAF